MPGEKRGEVHAELRGELMGILDFASFRPNQRVGDEWLRAPRDHFQHKSIAVPI